MEDVSKVSRFELIHAKLRPPPSSGVVYWCWSTSIKWSEDSNLCAPGSVRSAAGGGGRRGGGGQGGATLQHLHWPLGGATDIRRRRERIQSVRRTDDGGPVLWVEVGRVWVEGRPLRCHGEGDGGEVREEAGLERIARLQAFHGAQVAGNLRQTLPETQRQKVQGQSVDVQAA